MIPTSYTLQNDILEKVASAEYLEAELTETLHWGKQVKFAAAKASKLLLLPTEI